MRGKGRLYKRGRIWWIQYNHRGKTYRESTGVENEKMAGRLLLKRRAEAEANGRVTGPIQEKVTISELGEMIENDYRMRRRATLRPIFSIRERFIQFFGDIRALDLTTDKITAYIIWRQENQRTNRTIRKELVLLKGCSRLP